ncbi:MAG: archaetidylserine decarboxylase [Pseudohongiella sp.]|nr:archaetidylserine decarboxylase [Pseudohongiella sp.]MDP2125809.1 archaetidylserine decarboxylase [Pseudohongiella sp.]
MKSSLFIPLQYILPQHLLSRLAGKLANCRISFIKTGFINWFVNRYKVDMSEAAEPDTSAYADFNSFFTRALREGARPIDPDPAHIICPADGAISQLGAIEQDRIFQAKDRSYSLQALLGGDAELAEKFTGGCFATVYLSPRDYHRVHMPFGGTLRSMTYVPGKLFSVNTMTSEHVDALFARNERVVCIFDTDAGPMALVLVGAMIVAGVETVWANHVCPNNHAQVSTDYQKNMPPVMLRKGEEMGRFKLGSTVVAVFGPDMVKLDAALTALAPVRMGQTMGIINTYP